MLFIYCLIFLSLVCVSSVLCPCFVMHLCPFYVCNHLDEKKRTGFLYFNCLPDISVA